MRGGGKAARVSISYLGRRAQGGRTQANAAGPKARPTPQAAAARQSISGPRHHEHPRRRPRAVCEAASNAALSRGAKQFKQRVGRGINAQLGGRRGPVFLDRYHMEILRTPRQTRNTLVYVLHNARKHGEPLPLGRPDPFSSSFWFDGWEDDSWKCGRSPPPDGCCVSTPRTWLLVSGWRRGGLIGVDEAPGAVGRHEARRCRSPFGHAVAVPGGRVGRQHGGSTAGSGACCPHVTMELVP